MVAQGRPGQGSDHNTSKHPELDGMPRCCRIATHGTSGLLQTHAPVLARCQCYRYDLCLARFVARLELELDRIQTDTVSVTGTMMPFLACLLLPRLVREINEPKGHYVNITFAGGDFLSPPVPLELTAPVR